MPTFTIRMVLHKANSDDYAQLADEMAEQGFVDVVTDSESGKAYKLPDAEYTGTADDLATAMKKAKAAAEQVGKKYSVFITQANGRRWFNLDPA